LTCSPPRNDCGRWSAWNARHAGCGLRSKRYEAQSPSGKVNSRMSATVLTHAVAVVIDKKPSRIVQFYSSLAAAEKAAS
jgi:hypothetical protein